VIKRQILETTNISLFVRFQTKKRKLSKINWHFESLVETRTARLKLVTSRLFDSVGNDWKMEKKFEQKNTGSILLPIDLGLKHFLSAINNIGWMG